MTLIRSEAKSQICGSHGRTEVGNLMVVILKLIFLTL